MNIAHTAFVDFFRRGPVDKPTRVTGFEDFVRTFGGLDARSEGSYAIQQYYLNGGQIAWVVRVITGAARASRMTLQGGPPLHDALVVEAASPGTWGDNLEVAVTEVLGATFSGRFDLFVREVLVERGSRVVINAETYRNLSMSERDRRDTLSVVNETSELVRLRDVGMEVSPQMPRRLPPATVQETPSGNAPDSAYQKLREGNDGDPPDGTTLVHGLSGLDRISPFTFNILCLPAAAAVDDVSMRTVVSRAAKVCEDKRAFYIVDIPSVVDTADKMLAWMTQHDGLRHRNAAIYFPRLEIADGLNINRPRNVGSSGTVAGLYARTDTARGVWKAPSGPDSDLHGARPVTRISDVEDLALHPSGVNTLRTIPGYGDVAWGARTLHEPDEQASEWKYIPVRRTALYIEQSLYRGLKWVVFEPNDEPLWAQIRLNVDVFMQDLFRQGAFQGTTPRDAYFVKCDRETTTQHDVDGGIVNILVGFAPLLPTEFVVIKIQLMAEQVRKRGNSRCLS